MSQTDWRPAISTASLGAIQNSQVQIAFGTYRLPAASTQRRIQTILELGVRRIDAAQLYRNEHEVFDAVRRFEERFETRGQHVHVTSKIYRNLLYEQVIETVTESAAMLGRRIDTMLLHRCLPFHVWRALDECVTRGLVGEIGVSNHSKAQLASLLQRSELGGVRQPAVNQVELHPFGGVHPLLRFCAAKRVRVEGHTLLGRGEFMDFAPLVRLAAKYAVSPAVVLLRWAHQLGAGLVFSSRQDPRVREVLERVPQLVLEDDDIAAISGFYTQRTHRFYPQHDYRQYAVSAHRRYAERALHDRIPEDSAAYVELVVRQLREDIRAKDAGRAVSLTALELPTQTTRQILTDPIAQKIAARLFPPRPGKPAHSSFDRYRALVRVLRRLAHAAQEAERKAVHLKWHWPRVAQEPIADVVANPAAMPVCVAPREELLPFFRFLCDQTDVDTSAEAARTFVRGTYFADGRMDLCKQVVGPDHIGELCGAVAQSQHIRHFLLGNNIVCAGCSGVGAESLAELMANPNLDIETWYLAGNTIGPEDLQIIAEALIHNDAARSLWLKRNPLGQAGAVHIGRLLAKNRRLALLDLHTTALFDEGVEALARAMKGAPLRLRHLYLSANALSARSIRALRSTIHDGSPLESLYLSMNRLRQDGLDEVVSLLETGHLRNLRRLDLGAIGLESPALTPLVDALIRDCPKLGFLDLGTYKSTRHMGERANVLDDVDALRRLLVEHPSLKVLDVSLCGLAKSSMGALVDALRPDQSLEGVGTYALGHSHRERRRIKQPGSVVHIDSIYRGRTE